MSLGFNKHFLSLIFLFLLVTPLVSSATIQFLTGYEISPSLQVTYEQDKDILIDFFVYNKSNGNLVTNVTTKCSYYLADNQGTVLTNLNVPYLSLGYWSINIDGSNFTRLGKYNYGIKCNDTIQGGAYTGEYKITPDGLDLSSALYWLIIALGFGVMILGLWREDYTITTLGSFGLVLVGLNILFYGIEGLKNSMSNGISIIILAVSGYVMIKTGIEFVQEYLNG